MLSFFLGVAVTYNDLFFQSGGLAEERVGQLRTINTTQATETDTPIVEAEVVPDETLPPEDHQITLPTLTSTRSGPISQYSSHFHPASPELLESIQTLIEPRVWDFWPRNQSLPCFAPDEELGWLLEWDLHNGGYRGKNSKLGGGLFMTKPAKVGGSTAAGVHLRIMHQLSERLEKDFAVCRGNFRHGPAWHYKDIAKQSFLWSIVRDPTKRAISEFFHFQVSRAKMEPTETNFLGKLKMLPPLPKNFHKVGHYGEVLSLESKRNKRKMDALDVYKGILESYNFIAVTERMDESLVVLKELLGLKTSDILYLSAKQNGGWDDGKAGGCVLIQKSYVSPGMHEVFESHEWLSKNEYEMALHVAVNKSLDLTIDERIGRNRFEKVLAEYQHLQQLVRRRCEEEAKYPCTAEGKRRNDDETDCYWGDAGCGFPCIDRVVAEFKLGR